MEWRTDKRHTDHVFVYIHIASLNLIYKFMLVKFAKIALGNNWNFRFGTILERWKDTHTHTQNIITLSVKLIINNQMWRFNVTTSIIVTKFFCYSRVHRNKNSTIRIRIHHPWWHVRKVFHECVEFWRKLKRNR